MIAECLYHYRAVVVDVYDGDTIRCDVDLGFNCWLRNVAFRLYGINAPEVRGAERLEGLKTRDWLRTRVLGQRVTLVTIADGKGKYGRWLARIYDDAGDVIADMVSEELAVYKEY